MSARCVHCKVDLTDDEFQRGDFCEPCDKKLADQMGDDDGSPDEYEQWLEENENDPTMEGWTP